MVEQVVSALDYSLCAEAALVIFAVTFVAVSVRTLVQKRSWSERQAAIPLEEPPRRNSHV